MIDPLGLSACYVNFPDYPITYNNDGDTSTWLGGHSGVMGYDDNGRTRYYDYGRYSRGIGHNLSGNDGNVRRIPIPDLQMGPDGKPTKESWQNLKTYLKENAGKNTNPDMKCDEDANENDTYKYMEDIARNKNRPKYNWNPFSRTI